MELERNRKRKLNQACYTQILLAFRESPQSLTSLMDLTGLHFRTLTPLLAMWHKQRLIHVCEWLPDSLNRHVVPRFAWGDADDVPRKSQEELWAEKAARQRAKRRAARQKGKEAGMVFASMVNVLASPK